MKNSILFLSVLFTSISFAQELATNKNGKIFNPESGDWGLSIEATPFINFAADLVHIGAGKTEDAPTFNGLNDQAPTWAISGKYFIANDRAIRASLRLNAKRDRQTSEIIYDPNATATNWPNNQSTDFTKDVFKTNDWAIALGGGYEWRKGTRRLQGYYGAECIIALSNRSNRYSYAYDLLAPDTDPATADNLRDYTTDFGQITDVPGEYISRQTSFKNGMTVALGVRGFVGVEFFVAPKISLGGEFGWGLGIAHTGRATTTEEGIDYLEDDGTSIVGGTVVENVKSKGGNRSTQFFIGSDRENSGADPSKLWMNSFSPAGNLSLNFYF